MDPSFRMDILFDCIDFTFVPTEEKCFYEKFLFNIFVPISIGLKKQFNFYKNHRRELGEMKMSMIPSGTEIYILTVLLIT